MLITRESCSDMRVSLPREVGKARQCMVEDCERWLWCCVSVMEWLSEDVWLDVLADCSLCVWCEWLVGPTCLQGGAVYIHGGEGTFTNCNFTSNDATVSLEISHVDDSEMSQCMTLRLCPAFTSLTDCFELPASCFIWLFIVILSCDWRSWPHSWLLFSTLCMCVYA